MGRCSYCQANLSEGDAFCSECGASASTGKLPPARSNSKPKCLSCGFELKPADAFCSECGKSVAWKKPITPSVRPITSHLPQQSNGSPGGQAGPDGTRDGETQGSKHSATITAQHPRSSNLSFSEMQAVREHVRQRRQFLTLIAVLVFAAVVTLGFHVKKQHEIRLVVDQGQEAYERGDYDAAIQTYLHAIKMGAGHGSTAVVGTVENLNWRIGENYAMKGKIAFDGGNTDSGIGYYKTALQYDANSPDLQNDLSTALANKPTVDAAVAASAAQAQIQQEQAQARQEQAQAQQAQAQQAMHEIMDCSHIRITRPFDNCSYDDTVCTQNYNVAEQLYLQRLQSAGCTTP